MTKSLSMAHDDLRLKQVFIVYPGKSSYPLNEWAEAVAIADLRSRAENPGARHR